MARKKNVCEECNGELGVDGVCQECGWTKEDDAVEVKEDTDDEESDLNEDEEGNEEEY